MSLSMHSIHVCVNLESLIIKVRNKKVLDPCLVHQKSFLPGLFTTSPLVAVWLESRNHTSFLLFLSVVEVSHTKSDTNTKESNNNSDLLNNAQHKRTSLVGVDKTEGAVVDEERQKGVDDSDKKEWRGNRNCQQTTTLTRLKTGPTTNQDEKQQVQNNPRDDVHNHANLYLSGGVLHTLLVHVTCEAVDAQHDGNHVEDTID